MIDARIVIFAKPPVPGRAKTRLAAEVGHERAAALARAFLADTVALASGLGAEVWISTTEPEHPALRACTGTLRHIDQGGGDLGDRMVHSLTLALDGAGKAIAMGADCPGLTRAMVQGVLSGLEAHDAVLAPAEDGGFWALGLTRCPPGLLAAPMPWSTAEACAATRARLLERGLTVGQGAGWFDVDVAGDLDRVRTELASSEGGWPHTRVLLG